ncbi:MAG: MATE family efflux transporter [Bacilli bacterium]|jgi:putative MATE family efflux protein|nr:MATE family efflux transporter [Bacilli bacterium]
MKKVDLGKENINKLLISFAIPCVISMLINSVYNIVDQIFIGKGVGTLGNAATNVIFPLVIIFNAVAGLIGNGAAANLSLKLGEGKKEEGGKIVGNAVTVSIIFSIILSVIAYFFLPKLVYMFGCTENVYQYAVDYGKIIILGAPFMIIYSALSQLIRADGSPKYSMVLLVVGAILNIILDPIFIFTFNMGVKGGAIATVIGQIVSFVMAILYLKKVKSVKLEKESFKVDKSITRTLGLGLSSFITQSTVLALFVFMNNMMTKYGALTKYGADIPLSVYGVISKINSLYISTILGISIGAQPIIGFNYGAGNYERVKETLRKVLTINLVVGLIFNIIFYLFPKEIVSIFITNSDPNYKLFLEFAVVICHSFLLVMGLNFLEMTTSITVQSLGNVKKATMVSFIRQIILFIPIACFMAIYLHKGIYGVLNAGPIADAITFFIALVIFYSEYRKLSIKEKPTNLEDIKVNNTYKGKKIVITISREYGSGGHYVGELLAKRMGINFYDKNLINLISKKSGLSKEYVEANSQKLASFKYIDNNDDRIFIAEEKVIKDLAKKEPCVIVGRCADYILKDNKDTIKVFLYSSSQDKVKRAVKYYNLEEDKALKEINKINSERAKHYKYYTNRDWYDFANYDIALNVDYLGVEKTAELLEQVIREVSH